MNIGDDALARRTLAATGLFGADEVGQARIGRLFGLTNSVFRVDLAGGRFALRIPGSKSVGLIDRVCEEKNAREAARIGVAPEVVHFAVDGVMLTRFIDGAPMSPALFRANPRAIVQTAATLRRLHDEAQEFAGTFDAFERMSFYRKLLAERGSELAAETGELVERAEALRQALAARPAAPRPCHCDPTGRNIILGTDDRVRLLDWEYSGMNDPAWDLAYLSVEGDFNAEADAALLAAYFGRPANAADAARVEIFKALCQVLSALWALVQHSAGNSSADFSAYADATFAAAATRMRNSAFSAHLKAPGVA